MTPGTLAIDLAQQLIRLDSTSHGGTEDRCARLIGARLQQAGFEVSYDTYGEAHTSLTATLGNDRGKVLCLTGHLDTVPCGAQPWRFDPFSGDIVEGRLLGRGACDMKSGVAAIVSAALSQAERLRHTSGVVLILTAGEEVGCQGARHLLRRRGPLPQVGAILVAEPTANRVLLGHKGALWLRFALQGKSAHGSMPEQGESALLKGIYLASHLARFRVGEHRHPHLGMPTLNIGSFHSGNQPNMVPDRAEMTVDIRTTPDQPHAQVIRRLHDHLSEHHTELETLLDLPSIWSDVDHPWVASVVACVERHLGSPALAGGASYFTDGCVLGPATDNAPVLIVGPGDPAMAHQTNEFCEVAQIQQAVDIYTEVLQSWAERGTDMAAPPAPKTVASRTNRSPA